MNTWDAPLLSPRRLFNAVRLYCYFKRREPVRYYPLSFYFKWYRRKEARFQRLGH